MAADTFSALGSMVCSNVLFNGMAGRHSEPNVITGASSEVKHFSLIKPLSERAKLFCAGSSVSTKHLLHLRTAEKMASSSSG